MHWREKQLLDAFHEEKLTTTEIVSRVNMSKSTALRYLKKLKEKNLVDYEDIGTTKVWFLKRGGKKFYKKIKVLVVDDDEHVINIIRDYLEPDIFEVLEATNGMEALGMVLSRSPDILILDIMMQRMDGYRVCEEMKKHADTKDIPIIILSAKTTVDDKLKAIDLGINDYIEKPFDLRELKARINIALGSYLDTQYSD